MTILETLQTIPNVQVIYADEEKIFCSVRITVVRNEQINSGSMMFNHPRYITFGQLVVFSDKEVENDQGGALFFKMTTPEEVKDIIENITDYIPHEKEQPNDAAIIGEII